MRIADHGILVSSRQKQERVRLRTETDLSRRQFAPPGNMNSPPDWRAFFSRYLNRIEQPALDQARSHPHDRESMSAFRARIIRMILDAFSVDTRSDLPRREDHDDKEIPASPPAKNDGNTFEQARMTRIVQIRDTHYERTSLSVAANGWVTLEDGREFAFASRLSMSRSEYRDLAIKYRIDDGPGNPLVINEEAVLEYREQVAGMQYGEVMVDPLIVNFDGKGAALSTIKVVFDLDGDGRSDFFSQLAEGSRFLALDRNGNGTIDDGTELFGPSTGRGFSELALLDNDGNRWIDENDPVFSRLRLWQPGEKAGTPLLDMDVGAVYVNAVSGQMAIQDAGDRVQGQVREHAVWLRQSDGSPGFIQEADLVVG